VAIEKSAKVLAYYSDSKYVDDALLLMAKCYFRLGEYGRGVRKCDELLTTFAGSDLVPEAHYWRAMSQYRLGDTEEAESRLRTISESAESPFRGDAAFAIAEMAHERGDLDEAIDLYRVALSTAVERGFRIRARRTLGDCLMEADRPGEAVPVYTSLAEMVRSNKDRFEALVKVAGAQRATGDFDDALATLEPMLKDDRFDDYVSRATLEIGKAREDQGRIEAAAVLYQGIIDDAEREATSGRSNSTSRRGREETEQPRRAASAEEAEAHYRLGRIQEQTYHNLPKAGEHYAAAATNRNSEAGKLAVDLEAGIARWTELHVALADTDSVAVEQRDQTMFALGEHFYFGLGDADSALGYFEAIVDSFPESATRPRSIYAAGWLWKYTRGDSVTADSIWAPLLADTTDSPLIAELQDAIAGPDAPKPEDPAIGAYRAAEDAWGEALRTIPPEPPDSLADSLAQAAWWGRWANEHRALSGTYVPKFEAVIDSFPESRFSVRARFVLGWAAENVKSDTATAYNWFRSAAADTLSDPEIADMARELLELRAGPARPESAEQAPSDSIRAAAADSSMAASDSVGVATQLEAPTTMPDRPVSSRAGPDDRPRRGRGGRPGPRDLGTTADSTDRGGVDER